MSRPLTLAFVATVFLTAAVSAQQAPPPAAPAAAPPAVEAPVSLEGRTVLLIRTSLGPFTAAERASAASARLSAVAHDTSVAADAVTTTRSDSSTDIVAGDRVLMTVTDADARAAGMSRADLAAADVAALRGAIANARSEFGTRTLLLGLLYAVLITLLLVAVIAALSRLATALRRTLRRVSFPALRIQRVVLVSAWRVHAILLQSVSAVRALLVLAAFSVYLPTLLSLFPWTRPYASRLSDYVVTPLRSAAASAVAYLHSLVVIVICVVAAYLLIRVAHFAFNEIGRGTISWPGFYPEWAEPTFKLVRTLIIAITVVVMFPYLPGSESPAFRGVSIFLGVLFSLGSTSAVANVIAGVILIYTRAFRTGDRVKIGETIGDVVESTLLVTRLRTIKNEIITVPNSMVITTHIVNFTIAADGPPLILHTAVTIGYDARWRTVHDLLVAAASKTAGVLADPAPFVLQTALNDFFVTYEINAYTREASRMAVIYAELHQHIQDCFNEAGVEIMSPHYASLRDGNTTAIPEEYRAQEPPRGFKVERG